MKRPAVFFQTALLIMTISVTYSQSLGDLAKEENERRKQVQNEKVITDEEAGRYRSSSLTANMTDQPQSTVKPEPDKASPAPGRKKAESDEPVDLEGRPESYWRETMAVARQKVKNLENQATEITLRINSLQNEFYREDDGFKREGVQRDLQKNYYEQDKNKEELEKAKDIVQDLEKEAKRSGALPGWLASEK